MHPDPAIAKRSGAEEGSDALDLQFRAEPFAVREALRRVMTRFAHCMTPDEAGALELALAEVLNNISEHAYSDMAPGLIALHLRHEGMGLTCRIEDHGRPMPGRVLPNVHLPAAPYRADFPEGGWGWALIFHLTDGLDYTRSNGRNILVFRIPPRR